MVNGKARWHVLSKGLSGDAASDGSVRARAEAVNAVGLCCKLHAQVLGLQRRAPTRARLRVPTLLHERRHQAGHDCGARSRQARGC